MSTLSALSYQYDIAQLKYKEMEKDETLKELKIKHELCKLPGTKIRIITDYSDINDMNIKYHGHGFNKGDIVYINQVEDINFSRFKVYVGNWCLLSYEFEIYNSNLNNIKKKAYSEILKNLK